MSEFSTFLEQIESNGWLDRFVPCDEGLALRDAQGEVALLRNDGVYTLTVRCRDCRSSLSCEYRVDAVTNFTLRTWCDMKINKPTTYTCASCDKPALVSLDNKVIKTCQCTSGIIAHLNATASGKGGCDS